jgi:flagellar protein FliS
MSYAAPSNNRYLDGRVITASQPELQVMLLEGALRFGRQARQAWDDPVLQVEASRLLTRTLDIAEELVRSVSGGSTPQSKRLEEEYAFAFRAIAAAHMGHDAVHLDEALNLLAFHRDTWRQACDKLKSQPAPVPRVDGPTAPVAGFSFHA